MANGSLIEHFFHIFLKAESQEVVVLCKLYVVCLYPSMHNTDQSNELLEITSFP